MRSDPRSWSRLISALTSVTVLLGCGEARPKELLTGVALSSQQRASDSQPSARGYARMAYAGDLARVLMVGGQGFASWGCGLAGSGGAWTFDAGPRRWSELASSNPFTTDLVAYDSRARRVIAWVSSAPVGDCVNDLPDWRSETWALDPVTSVWEQRHPANSPPAGLLSTGAQMVYDAACDRTIMFGGLNFPKLIELFSGGAVTPEEVLPPDTWAYDYEGDTWIKANPPVSPPGRSAHSLAYDGAAKRIVLFGGATDFPDLDDTWTYDCGGDAWTRVETVTRPSARHYAPMAYAAEDGVVVLFGGSNFDESEIFGDTWTFDVRAGTWTLRRPSSAPSARAWHDVAYSEKANAVVLFGGGPSRDGFTAETWLYRVNSDRWTQVTPP